MSCVYTPCLQLCTIGIHTTHSKVPEHTSTHRPVSSSGRWGPLKLLSDAQREMDPGKTKGHAERPLYFSAVLFPRHTPTHTLSVTSQTRPWHLGHLSTGSASLYLSPSLSLWQVVMAQSGWMSMALGRRSLFSLLWPQRRTSVRSFHFFSTAGQSCPEVKK